MSLGQYLMFVVVTGTFLLSPGPSVLLSISNGVRYGVRRAAVGVMGNVLAFQMLMLLSAAGLGVALTASVEVFAFLKLAGAAYLIYLGLKLWRSPARRLGGLPSEDKASTGRAGIFRQAFFTTSSNPKALIYVSALLPQFLDTQRPLLPQLALLGLTAAVIQFVVFMAYAILGHQSGRWFESETRLRLFNRLSGVTFIGFGLALGLSRNRP